MRLLYIVLVFLLITSPIASAAIVGNFSNPIPLKTVSLAEVPLQKILKFE